MTTNHIENLDDALIRQGRVDQKVELGLADREVLTELFRIVYEPWGCDKDETPMERGDTADSLAADFASLVPELEFSSAEIMSFLIDNRRSPHMAVANVEGWVTKTKEQREKIKRTDSWVVSA
jgi:chaperone BCS1